MFLSQSKFADEILERAHMQNCNLHRNPADIESKLGSDGDPISDPTLYQSLAGAFQYLTFTRLDLSYAIQQAGCLVTRWSTSRYFLFLDDNLLSWYAKRHVPLSRSRAEVEYRGVANVVPETAWIRNLLLELHSPLFTATLVYCDNVNAVHDPQAQFANQQWGSFYVLKNYAYVPSAFPSQVTMLLLAFQTMTIQDLGWNIVTGASSHLVDNTDKMDYFHYDSTDDLYPVTQQPSFQTPVVLLSFSSTTWHRRLCHLEDDVLLRLESSIRLVLLPTDVVSSRRIIALLHCEFAMIDRGSLNYFLGIFAQQSVSGMFLSQSKFADEILERAHMQNCNLRRTPADTESKLGSDGDPVSDPTLYCSLAGVLQYLTFTRPDLSYVIQKDGFPVTRRSTFEYGLFLNDSLLSWSAKRHVTLLCSSAEAEYHGVANVVVETAWIHNLLLELHSPLFTATLVYCDNVSAVYMSTNLVQHHRTKHIEIDIHFVHDYVASRKVHVLHVPSRFLYADIFTKGLPSALFLEFHSSLNF
nr:ribonuclease H-like domain-containing protein [Tanacetum cinerariifolium]